MRLHQLLRELDPRFNFAGIADVEIGGICEDSRAVAAGDLFIARAGKTSDGAKFIAQAIERGAAAVIASSPAADCPATQVIVRDPAAITPALAHIFYGHPSKSVRSVAVTGTNGKTTTTYVLRHVLNKLNIRCGLIGTVETDDGKTRREATMTTPGAVELAKLLAAIRDNGCGACVMETSSHALDQGRVEGIRFAGAAFTNLTRDHLDYHETMENYAAAKAKLFASLDEDAIAVVNADDKWSERMIVRCKARVVKFGFGDEADYSARDVAMTSQGSKFILHTPDGSAEVKLGMIGRHNIANAMTAAALLGEVFRLGVHQIAAGLQEAQGAPGRLQAVRCGQKFAVLVDYAHTDDALEKVLMALRPLTRGKLRVLFGCGGDRDRTKRPLMARAAERLADVVYVTSDNPRTEKPGDIIEQIVAGFLERVEKSVIVEPDRRTAIGKILEDAKPGDVVLIAGKGHENYQIVGQVRHHFDDVEEAMDVLRKGSVSGNA
ncbi:MAG TPA: UDP-N-acetylmuramoyl-L-alanyl-D-glutamate--2,6-diaminopimelate ligase [Tepidisphaeraceae bacterium]